MLASLNKKICYNKRLPQYTFSIIVRRLEILDLKFLGKQNLLAIHDGVAKNPYH